jgi:hypothetical protein
VGDTVCELAAALLEENRWPELLPFLFQAVNAGPDTLRESALLIFAQLALYVGPTMGPYLPTLHQGALRARLAAAARCGTHTARPSISARIAARRATHRGACAWP